MTICGKMVHIKGKENESMSRIWMWIGYACIIITLVTIIVGDLLILWYFIKCGRVKECCNSRCRYKVYSPKYKDRITQEIKERLQSLIDQL